MEDQKTAFSLQLTERDSVINEWLQTFDQIEQDLAQIKEKEKMITLQSSDSEISKSRKDKIREDIKYINTLLEANKQKIASLNAQLKKAGVTMKALEDKVATLEASVKQYESCLLYTSDAADDLLCVDLGGRRIIKKKKNIKNK